MQPHPSLRPPKGLARLSKALSNSVISACDGIIFRFTTTSVSVLFAFQLPTSSAPIEKPSSISVRRDMPLQITRFPGGESPTRAK
jgi:hypothetical protein